MRPVTPRIGDDLRDNLHPVPGVEGCTLRNEGLVRRNGGVIPWNGGVNPGVGGVDPRNHGIVRGMRA
jgi:hypothetical protein